MHVIYKKSQVKSSLTEIQNCNCSKDRKYTLGPLEETLKFLEIHNVHDIPDFTALLTNYGFKSKEIITCFQSYVDDFNHTHENQQITFNRRSFRQMRYYHKNFEIARLVYSHEQSLLAYLRYYASKKLSKKDIEKFIGKMKLRFDKIKSQADKIDNTPLIKSHESNFSTEFCIIGNYDNDDFELDLNNDDEDSYFDLPFNEYQSFFL